jgi:release factor glutamine methyltransferase
VFAEDEAGLLAGQTSDQVELAELVRRRAAGEPLEYVLGWAEFAGLRIELEPGVFVPRRRTEFLVDQAAQLAGTGTGAGTGAGGIAVDLCCGSGALGAALVRRVRLRALHAADLDPAAVRCAARNLAPVGGQVHQGDLYDALPTGLRSLVDVLLANVPYVPTGEIALLPAEARLHEARVALDGGSDGLDLLRRVAAGAPDWLAPGGYLLSEVSERQVPAALAVLTEAGLEASSVSSEEFAATVVIGTVGNDTMVRAAP